MMDLECIARLEFERTVFKFAKSCSGKEFLNYVNKYLKHSASWHDIQSLNKDTIAHFAAQSGCVEILKYLLEYEKTVLEQVNLDKKTPLHVAAQSSQFNCVEFLLSCGIEVDPLKKGDWTPLMLACTKPDMYIIERLLQYRANPLYKNKDGWTPFHIACREGNSIAIRELLEFNPKLWKTRSNNLRTPLHTAALHGQFATVEMLLIVGGYKTDEKDVCGLTPLMDAGAADHVDIMKLLIKKHKASCEEVDVLSRNVLHIAAMSGALESIRFLVKECAMDVNRQTLDGLTPLHFSARENNVKCMKLLLCLGAQYRIKDDRGRTAYKYLNRGYHLNDTSTFDTSLYHDTFACYGTTAYNYDTPARTGTSTNFVCTFWDPSAIHCNKPTCSKALTSCDSINNKTSTCDTTTSNNTPTCSNASTSCASASNNTSTSCVSTSNKTSTCDTTSNNTSTSCDSASNNTSTLCDSERNKTSKMCETLQVIKKS